MFLSAINRLLCVTKIVQKKFETTLPSRIVALTNGLPLKKMLVKTEFKTEQLEYTHCRKCVGGPTPLEKITMIKRGDISWAPIENSIPTELPGKLKSVCLSVCRSVWQTRIMRMMI